MAPLMDDPRESWTATSTRGQMERFHPRRARRAQGLAGRRVRAGLGYAPGMHRAFVALALVVFSSSAALVACAPTTPIKTASGELVDGVAFEEHFPLSKDGREVTLHGDKLKAAVQLLDKHGVIGMNGNYEPSKSVLDKGTLVVSVHSPDDKQRSVTVKNCAEPHVCAFFAEAVQTGVTDKTPVVCREAVACTKK